MNDQNELLKSTNSKLISSKAITKRIEEIVRYGWFEQGDENLFDEEERIKFFTQAIEPEIKQLLSETVEGLRMQREENMEYDIYGKPDLDYNDAVDMQNKAIDAIQEGLKND